MSKPIYYAFLQDSVGPGDTPGVNLLYYRPSLDWHHELLDKAVTEGNRKWAYSITDSFIDDAKTGKDYVLLMLAWFPSSEAFFNGSKGLDVNSSDTTIEKLDSHHDYQLNVYNTREQALEAMRDGSAD